MTITSQNLIRWSGLAAIAGGDRNHDLPVSRQVQMLNIGRGSIYYLPRATSPADLALMRRIDELHLDYPFAGARIGAALVKIWRWSFASPPARCCVTADIEQLSGDQETNRQLKAGAHILISGGHDDPP
jgi:hypothetical protein